jgi:hypothetical protein
MAYVAINPAFMSRVQAKIQSMCDAELKTLGDIPIPQITEKSDFFLDNVWGEHRNLLNMMPSEYKNNFHEFRIAVEIGERSFCLNIPTKHMVDCYPPNYSWYNPSKVDADPEKYPEVRQMMEHLQARDEILTRWDNVSDKVLGFLRECKSANEATKVWPDIKIYLDADDIRRVELKQDKTARASKAAEALAGLDTDELMGAAVIARLSGAEV